MGASLYTSKITGGLLHQIDSQIKKEGLSETMESIFKKTKTEIIYSKDDPEVDKVLENDPLILISNHPSEIEVLIYLSLFKTRKDVYLVANHNFLKILPSIDRQIIPVYIIHRLTQSSFNLKFRIFKHIHEAQHFSKEISHQKNVDSILNAAKKVSNGAVVIIFPAADESDGHFLSGIGHMIKNLTNKSRAKLVMAHVSGTSNLDFLRIIPFVNRFLPKIKINFAKPINISKYSKQEAKLITSEVEKDYFKWVEENV